MSAPGQDQQSVDERPVGPGGIVPEDPARVTNALLIAVRRAAEDAAAAQDPREVQELLSGALSAAQAIVVLDPSLSQGGTPIAHDLAMEQTRQAGQAQVARVQGEAAVAVERTRGEHAVRQARAAAAAPTPAKERTVSVSRDGSGRASEYKVRD